jgi:hypothetical protein
LGAAVASSILPRVDVLLVFEISCHRVALKEQLIVAAGFSVKNFKSP